MRSHHANKDNSPDSGSSPAASTDEIAKRVAKHKAKAAEKQAGGSKLRAQRKYEAKLKFEEENRPKAPRVATPEETEANRRRDEEAARARAAEIVRRQREQYGPGTGSPEDNAAGSHSTLKKAGVGLLAVGGTAAAALGIRHIMKKRAERKRREEEAKRKAHGTSRKLHTV